MSSKQFLLFIAPLLISPVISDGFTCIGQGLFKLAPPADLSQTVYWPVSWNDSMPPVRFASQQKCIWEVTVPDGLYASAVFYRDAPLSISIMLQYPNGQVIGLDNNDHIPYILTSPQFSVNLFKSAQQGAFSFKVKWSKYPEVGHDSIQLVAGSKPLATTPSPNITTFTSSASTVSLVAFSLKNQSHYPLLRQSAVYDGATTSAPFIGNLYHIMMQKKEKLSTGNSLTVYTWGLDQSFDYTLFMVQDHTGVPSNFLYSGANCFDEEDCPLKINAVYGTSIMATSGAHPEFIKSIDQFPENASLKIYEGAINDKNLVTTLTSANYKTRLPMELKNSIRQYVLDSKILNINLSHDSKNANWNIMYDGRKGFIHSFYHGEDSDQQYTDETFTTSGNSQLYFNYIVRDVDFTGDNVQLIVTVVSNGQLVASNIYTSLNPPPKTTTSIQGDGYGIKYTSHEFSTKGFRIDFSTTSTGYTPQSSTLSTSSKTSTTPLMSSKASTSASSLSTPSFFLSTKKPTVPVTTGKKPTSTSRIETTTGTSSNKFFICAFIGLMLFNF